MRSRPMTYASIENGVSTRAIQRDWKKRPKKREEKPSIREFELI
jgi:hypothetical protein